MAVRITFSIDAAPLREAFERAPEAMLGHLDAGLAQGADVVAVAARRGVQRDIFGTLRASIAQSKMAGLGPDTVGYEVRPGVHYARYVEEGTGPAVGRARYYPNPDSLLQFLTHSRGLRGFKWSGKAGSAARSTQEYALWWRARGMAWSIYMKGTRPAPFMRPAVDGSRSRVLQVIRLAVGAGAREVFGHGG